MNLLFSSIPEEQLLGLALFGEARGEQIEGQVAVGSVIRNRARLRKKSYPGIILAPNQFSCFFQQENLLVATYNTQGAVLVGIDKKVFQQCLHIARGILNELLIDNTKGSDHYCNWQLVRPFWTMKMTKTVTIGNHTFFRSQGK